MTGSIWYGELEHVQRLIIVEQTDLVAPGRRYIQGPKLILEFEGVVPEDRLGQFPSTDHPYDRRFPSFAQTAHMTSARPRTPWVPFLPSRSSPRTVASISRTRPTQFLSTPSREAEVSLDALDQEVLRSPAPGTRRPQWLPGWFPVYRVRRP